MWFAGCSCGGDCCRNNYKGSNACNQHFLLHDAERSSNRNYVSVFKQVKLRQIMTLLSIPCLTIYPQRMLLTLVVMLRDGKFCPAIVVFFFHCLSCWKREVRAQDGSFWKTQIYRNLVIKIIQMLSTRPLSAQTCHTILSTTNSLAQKSQDYVYTINHGNKNIKPLKRLCIL